MKLFFDTETTGLPKFDLPINHKEQPYIVQLAAILTTAEGKEINSLNLYIDNGKDCIIPEAATAIHGISTEFAQEKGVDIHLALEIFINMAQKANQIIGHNINFDIKMIEIAMIKLKSRHIFFDEKLEWATNLYCTMKESTNIVGIPKNHGGGNKWPKLTEAYHFAFGEHFDNAHDALSDVRATMRLYNWLQNRNVL